MPFRKSRASPISPLPGQINAHDTLATSLICACIASEGSSRNLFFDHSGQGNHGTGASGPTQNTPLAWPMGAGPRGKAISLGDPTNKNIARFAQGNFNIFGTQAFTIVLRVNVLDLSTSPVLFFQDAFQVAGYYCQLSTNGTINLSVNQSGANQSNASSAGAIVINTWQSVAVTRLGSVIKFFVNGRDVTATANVITNPQSTGHTFWIAGYDGSNGIPCSSLVSDFLFWKRALTASELLGLHENLSRPFAIPRRRIISAAPASPNSVDMWGQPASQPYRARTEIVSY